MPSIIVGAPVKTHAHLDINLNYLNSRQRTSVWLFKYANKNKIEKKRVEVRGVPRLILFFENERQKKIFLTKGHKEDPYFEFE